MIGDGIQRRQKMFWKKKKDPHERIEKIKEVLEKFEKQFRDLGYQIEILEQKFKSKWFPEDKKKKKRVEDISQDLECEEEPQDLISKVLLPE